ncbi:MAG TPA: c-type cytochrome [Acetobacteraceae bacterium]
MKKLTIALAIVAAAALAGCGRNDTGGSASTAGKDSGSTPSTTAQANPAPGSNSSTSNALSSGGGSGTASGGANSSTASTAPATGDSTMGAGTASSSGSGSTPSSDNVASAGNTAAMGAGPDAGKATFDQTCQVCHAAGVAGAPKLGDKADWGPRIAQGKNTLYTHALQGFTGKKGMMPPKGGNTALADADVKAAVDYMVAQAK